MGRWIILIVAFVAGVVRAEGVRTTMQNVMIEIALVSDGKRALRDDAIVDVAFTAPDGKTRKVPAFWAGGNIWKVRYASPIVGVHLYRSICKEDSSLDGKSGSIEVMKYEGSNPLYLHGPIRVASDHRHFEHLDGTRFFWLGDTWWMGLCERLHFPDEFATLADDRIKKGFNVVQIVAGLYPDMPAFDARGANEAGFPWEKDYSHIRPEYFDAADRRIEYLVEHGLAPCVVGAWGYHLPWLGIEKMKRHERYVYARWGAMPIVWCAAGELNLPFYLSPEFPNHGEKQTADWKQVIAYCRSINCFDRMITSHPTGIPPASMRGVLRDDSLLDFDMLQTPHGQMEVMGPTVECVRFSYALKPAMPIVNAEASYEMLFDRTPAEVSRAMFWVSWCSGVMGYTYGANGIWQLNRRQKPYGNSPWGGGYGKIAWNDAMNLAGSKQVGMAKKFLERFDWPNFRPIPNAAHYRDASDIKFGNWIWYEANAAHDAPIESRYFRREFDLPADAKIAGAKIRIAADDRFTSSLNDQSIGEGANWQQPGMFDVSKQLRARHNVLAIRAENVRAPSETNPAGLNFAMEVKLSDGRTMRIQSDASCQASKDESHWRAASVVGHYGDPPWGLIQAGNQYFIPYTIGDEKTRVVYVPQDKSIELEQPCAKASYFDPATGEERSAIGGKKIDSPGWKHDWVLVVRN